MSPGETDRLTFQTAAGVDADTDDAQSSIKVSDIQVNVDNDCDTSSDFLMQSFYSPRSLEWFKVKHTQRTNKYI